MMDNSHWLFTEKKESENIITTPFKLSDEAHNRAVVPASQLAISYAASKVHQTSRSIAVNSALLLTKPLLLYIANMEIFQCLLSECDRMSICFLYF